MNLSSRRDYGWHVLTTVETIAFRARHIAARAQPGLLVNEADRLLLFTGRIRQNIELLDEAIGDPGGSGHGTLVRDDGTPVSDRIDDPQARSVLTSLGHLDETVIALGRAFGIEATDPIPFAGKG